MPKIGEPAPDFALMTHAGKQIALAKLRGRKVLLWFYPGRILRAVRLKAAGFVINLAISSRTISRFWVSALTMSSRTPRLPRSTSFHFHCSGTDRSVGLAYGAVPIARRAMPTVSAS